MGQSQLCGGMEKSTTAETTASAAAAAVVSGDVTTTDVLIIGAGLTGLALARQLTNHNKEFMILEARSRPGGRIHTALTPDGAPVEMGATWYFPFFRNLFSLQKELGVGLTEQFSKGYTMHQSDARSAPRKVYSSGEEGDMFRITGGTSHLITRLLESLGKEDEAKRRVVYDSPVSEICRLETGQMEVREDLKHKLLQHVQKNFYLPE
jgi:uncharacterized protein with NAD-binding domain and iron-sulfur cluster